MSTYTIAKFKSFSSLQFEEKKQIISSGRPTPDLSNLTQESGRNRTSRSFNNDWYQKKKWLCGCSETLKLFCFPCLLFKGNSSSVWVTTGFCDIKNLNRSFERHESSETHIHSDIALKTFGKSRIDVAVSEQRKQEISFHNAKVSENRYILKCLIDTVIFLAKQELAFRGHDESEGSLNRGNYVELLHFQAEKDEKLSKHLKESKVFIGTSNKIQNDILDSIATVIQKDIEKEIGAANFIAIELDETTDNSNNAQISMIVRYVDKEGCPVEAFLGFDDVTRDKSADGIAKYMYVINHREKNFFLGIT